MHSKMKKTNWNPFDVNFPPEGEIRKFKLLKWWDFKFDYNFLGISGGNVIKCSSHGKLQSIL
jgi:hypothetical protein